jgi:hypothetical protein
MKWKVIDLEKGEMKFIEQSYKLNFYQQKTNNFISYSQKKTISFHNKLKKSFRLISSETPRALSFS